MCTAASVSRPAQSCQGLRCGKVCRISAAMPTVTQLARYRKRRAHMLRMLQQGLTKADIARRFHISRQRVGQILGGR